uniref:LysM domain-containing protein n=1 Tax=Aegilops tauschii subsp. strangulata TaxID=200361 RepID=A0A453NNA8_AEGTS
LAVAAPRCRVARAQQQYEANKQLNCYGTNGSSVLGYTCNATAAARPCASYVVFRSSPPYDSPVTISYLLNATTAALAGANAVPTVSPVAASRLVLAPLNCGCAPGGYYQHNASYTIQFSNETYFITANITYQGLTTCQALIAQNPNHDSRKLVVGNNLTVPIRCACPSPAQAASGVRHLLTTCQALIAQNPNHDSRKLVVGNNLTVPIRCACPSPAQAASGVRHLLTYLVTWGDGIADIAARFRVDAQAVLHANNLTDSENIYPFTTLLIPLKRA